ncbi:MAG TPA: arginine--tRNA ligase [Candidatus Limnocylindria bacterium]|nr:arginine--tRNA ligase [Candidatus Limnocylindria bacterium]
MSTTRRLVQEQVVNAFVAAVEDGRLPPFPPEPPVTFDVTRPASPEHGDYATNAALKMAGKMGRPPREIAAALAAAIGGGDDLIEKVEVAGPGFVNIFLARGFVERSVDYIRATGMDYGRTAMDAPKKINVEFVSANPTGPLHVGNARGAFVGDLLCRVLTAAGQQVTREYYFNDIGGQVERLGLSVQALKRGEPVPDDGYHGDYVGDLAKEVPDDVWHKAESEPENAGWILGAWASESIRGGIERSLENLGVHIDVWKGEGSLHSDGYVGRAIDKLKVSDDIYEQDGAQWFRSTKYGDDKDRVVIRSNGEPTYFASDIGYVSEKFGRGFDELIYIWGADHHGTIARLKNAAQALGLDRDATNVLLISWVHFVRDGVEVSMSKRTGEFVTLDELLDEIGVDAARWFFASRAPTTGIDFDIELAKKESSENPVYYVQYAHARISSILRKATEGGLKAADSMAGGLADDPVALGLAKDLLRLPDIVLDAAEERETQSITAYATELATTFHAFYRDRRVVDKDDPVTSGYRLALVDATRVTLAAALGLLGISAPDSM